MSQCSDNKITKLELVNNNFLDNLKQNCLNFYTNLKSDELFFCLRKKN